VRLIGRVVVREHPLGFGRTRELAAFEVIDDVAQRQVGFAAQAEIERRIAAQRFARHRRDVRAERECGGADGFGEEGAVEIVLERGGGDVRDVVLRPDPPHHPFERGPVQAIGDGVDHADGVGRMHDRGELRQRHLRPDHVLARAAADAML
jgi:hypothetical protein